MAGEMILFCSVKTFIPFFNKKVSIFTFCSVLGVIVALVQSALLLNMLSLSWWLLSILFVTSSVAFLFPALLIKVFTGNEDHVMLRYFITIIPFNFFVLEWLGQPVLPCLNILAVGYGTIIFFGRFGCYNAGCCHGRPGSFGVRYLQHHVRSGFPEYYSGVRLFPIQLVEALGILIIVSISIYTIFNFLPGMALSIFISLYCLLRFALEFFRGDPERHFFLTFSEAQWTILLLFGFLIFEGRAGKIPVYTWQEIVYGLLVTAFLIVAVIRVIRPATKISAPLHIREMMQTKLSQLNRPVNVHTTSLGINISQIRTAEGINYMLSSNRLKMDRSLAQKLAGILSLRKRGSVNIYEKGEGIFVVNVK